MADYNVMGISPVSMSAGGTIDANTIVKVGTTANSVVAATATSGVVIGVAMNDCVSGDICRVQTGGIAQVKVGAAVTLGDRLMWGTGNKALTSTGTVQHFGVALQAALADGDVIPVLLNCPTLGAVAT